ncbi:MAG: hypothetical protein EBX50_11655 [Chitinophagia bacterium]|nr:hypothetical protein [Chitinophagia bacterium]
MIRFEIPPKVYSRNQKIWRRIRFICGIALLALSIFFFLRNEIKALGNIVLAGYLILTYWPINSKKQLRFVEINDTRLRWNNDEEYNSLEELNWLEITRIKKLRHNELMFFVENSFYRRIWLNDYTPNEQQVILDTIKAYAERLSLTWVEEGPVAAVA